VLRIVAQSKMCDKKTPCGHSRSCTQNLLKLDGSGELECLTCQAEHLNQSMLSELANNFALIGLSGQQAKSSSDRASSNQSLNCESIIKYTDF